MTSLYSVPIVRYLSRFDLKMLTSVPHSYTVAVGGQNHSWGQKGGKNTDDLLYDNQLGADETVDPTTTVGGVQQCVELDRARR